MAPVSRLWTEAASGHCFDSESSAHHEDDKQLLGRLPLCKADLKQYLLLRCTTQGLYVIELTFPLSNVLYSTLTEKIVVVTGPEVVDFFNFEGHGSAASLEKHPEYCSRRELCGASGPDLQDVTPRRRFKTLEHLVPPSSATSAGVQLAVICKARNCASFTQVTAPILVLFMHSN
ncbi:uncharacterized protein BDZ99DRAFT_494069 [Mytilinidion resinicola]|uniref:Uncharacterized protein n=1 Tax=Mytilinidion resinicola TaxID=574789 RepID=A0A6A6Z4Z4_9PEZI|nr:uncharacterized protein BDZ99DRAFT_494069 [Mytilinidion resinicola]KAF2816202.1 hypothetical protein BDZ99DRAFT_494069 [Mytilinidion resinicola]